MPYMPPPKAPAKKVVRPAEAAAARQMAELATSPDEPLIRNTMVGRDPVRGAMLPQNDMHQVKMPVLISCSIL
jgi:hypothetical protein